jgi:ABC-type Na+ transport system ATPase subunit NatA
MAVIAIHGLTKRFRPVTAVDDLSFAVDQGTVVGFLDMQHEQPALVLDAIGDVVRAVRAGDPVAR